LKNEIYLTIPFIAIRNDEDGGDYDPTMGEYLVNPLDQDLLDVEISTGGFFSDAELGVIESNQNAKSFPVVRAGHAVQFGLSTRDEYNEMECHWNVRYRTAARGMVTVGFGMSKRRGDTVYFSDLPVLGGPGEVVRHSS